MRIGEFGVLSASLSSLVSAHNNGIPGAPRVLGHSGSSKLRISEASFPDPPGVSVRQSAVASKPSVHRIHRRQEPNIDGPCGKTIGSCAPGYCCSEAGWCGLGKEYCSGPDCQMDYGSGCDAHKSPRGVSTSGVARGQTNPGIPYGGVGISKCRVPGTVALTFDDGPYIYTKHILDLLESYNAKATFFITGNNIGKGQIDVESNGWADIMRIMFLRGHQLGSHTWSHQDLSTISRRQMENQIYYNEMAFRNILGFFPQYMRPPFSSCNTVCQDFLASTGYHVIYFDLDSEDYLHDDKTQIQVSKNDITGNLSTRANPSRDRWLVIEHDIHQQTAYNLTEHTLQQFQSKGFKMVTVGECLGDPKVNWYRKESDPAIPSAGPPVPSPSRMPISTTGQCGGSFGLTCQDSGIGDCCSPAGWCGSTPEYCGDGCQEGFGVCGIRIPSSGSLSASANGTCGKKSGYTCLNSKYGDCCSVNGWCGKGSDYCGGGCQGDFGKCGI